MREAISVENFVPHALRVGLSGHARDIEKRLLPHPEYYVNIQGRFPQSNHFQIERSILRNWGREFGKPGKYGAYWHEHVARYMKLLIPGTVITPGLMDEMEALEIGLAGGREILNCIGSKSQGKSAWFARLALALVSIDPEYTVAYMAAPFKNVADYTLWSETMACYQEIRNAHGDSFQGMRDVPSSKTIYFSEAHAKAGKIQLIGLDQTAKFQGAKSRDAERGFFILIADEIGVFPSTAFVEIIGNVTANQNFLGITGCNFKSILGMEGILCSPAGSEYQNLSMEKDQLWLSSYNSLTLRLDGHLCPNVLEKRDIYKFLLTEKKRLSMEEIHGLKGPKYLEQIRSFPNTSSDDQFVLSLEQIRAGGAHDKFWSHHQGSVWTRVAFCDPGFGGDPCKIVALEFGRSLIQAHDGTMHMVEIIHPVGPIETIKIESNALVSGDTLAKISRFSKSGAILTKEGRDLSADLQIALGAAEFCARHQIAASHFGFDSSMRGGVTKEMVSIFGPEILVYDTGNKPTEMVMDSLGAMASEKYRNLRSELFFTTAAVINSGQFRDAELVQDALAQICRHRVVRAGIKEAVESKDDFKKMNQGKSPDAADALTGAIHVARRKGFQLAMSKKQAASMFSPMESFDLVGVRPRASVARLGQ